jgi:HSP20 family protein
MLANRIFDEMNRLFDAVGFDPAPARSAVVYPPMNLWEDDDHFYAEAEMPGFKLDEIQITVTHGDQLTIAGERRPNTNDNWVWHRQECGYGRFARTVTLPAVVDVDKIEATYEAGVLTLTLPKSERAKPRRIAVKAVPELQAVTNGASR